MQLSSCNPHKKEKNQERKWKDIRALINIIKFIMHKSKKKKGMVIKELPFLAHDIKRQEPPLRSVIENRNRKN